MRATLAALLLLMLSLSGCINTGSDSGEFSVDEAEKPGWEVGDWWLYTFETAQFGEDTARLVVTEIQEDEGLYMLGISSEREAQRHAVVNHNPFLGRVTIDSLSVYENGSLNRYSISLGRKERSGGLPFSVNTGLQKQLARIEACL